MSRILCPACYNGEEIVDEPLLKAAYFCDECAVKVVRAEARLVSDRAVEPAQPEPEREA